MQTYKFLRQFLALPILGIFALLCSTYLYSQSPQAPSIQGPSVPTITVPTVSAPIAPVAPVLGTPMITTQSAGKNNSSSSLASSAISSDLTATALQTLSSFIGGETDTDALDSLGDLGSFSSLGDLGSLSSLLGSTDSGIQNTANIDSTNALLTQILQKLDTLFVAINENKVDATQITVSEQIAPQNFSQILRFSSTNIAENGQNASIYDILNTCRSIFISEPESDGTFLLTCDRVYSANGTLQNETFYMLFKAIETDIFEVAVSVQQSRENKNSILYRLSEYSPLVAIRTGNLVTLRSQNPAPQVDLLLDIDFTIN